jgi:hypothetical protein
VKVGGLLCSVVAAALVAVPAAAADDWWPHAADATWTYEWTDSEYSPNPTTEKITVKDPSGKLFNLAWAPPDSQHKTDSSTSGLMTFRDTNAGIIDPGFLNTTYPGFSTSLPPPGFPALCAQASGCLNFFSSTLFFLTWGSPAPVLQEPLLQGATWTGASDNSGQPQLSPPASSQSVYKGVQTVSVKAFSDPVQAAVVETTVTQAGALDDPYGSGVRTVWWVYGVGPVKIVFEHGGGADAPVTTSELVSTNQMPKAPPSDADYFPLKKGETLKYRWTNSRLFKKPSIQQFTIDAVVNNSARVTVRDLSGPVRVAGSYGFSLRLDGLTNLWTTTKAATLVKFPRLAKKRHFFTPFDLMVYGFNPVLPAYPAAGATWASKNPSRDFSIFGVNGSTRVLGVQHVKVPGGTFNALAVRSTLRQPGSKFGSGTRTSWFAPGKGLVKLVFRHGDGSTSTVVLLPNKK